jgi:hypothetical protein
MRKALGVFDSVGGIGLFVDAKDGEAKNYYEQFGVRFSPYAAATISPDADG